MELVTIICTIFLLLITKQKFIEALERESANLQLVAEDRIFQHENFMVQNVSSVTECHLLFLQHFQRSKSMNIIEYSSGFECQLMAKKTAIAQLVLKKGGQYYEPMKKDCFALKRQGNNISGIYTIYVQNRPTQVFCDMETDGGGWTVFQKRFNGSIGFYRNWTEYKRGFGDLGGEFWLGNELLHILTNRNKNGTEFWLEVKRFNGETNHTKYRKFRIVSEEQKYRVARTLEFDGGFFKSNIDGQPFSTYDADNDKASRNCAVEYSSGWWFKRCFNINLNGLYKNEGEYMKVTDLRGIIWKSFSGHYESLKETKMMIR